MDANLCKHKVHTFSMVSPDDLKSKIKTSASLAASPSSPITFCVSVDFFVLCSFFLEIHCTYELILLDSVGCGLRIDGDVVYFILARHYIESIDVVSIYLFGYYVSFDLTRLTGHRSSGNLVVR